MSIKFSIIVTTYNSSQKKLADTLGSCLLQTYENFEIIIADDGSQDNNEAFLIDYFKKHNYNNYRLCLNPKNLGTVKNLYSGVNISTGDYIKPISPGDLLYNENSLSDMSDFIEKNKPSACFGLLRAYSISTNNKIEKGRFTHPFDIDSYRNNNNKKILRNLILYSDNVCGAATVYSRKYLDKYLVDIFDIVKYEEDIIQVASAVDGDFMMLFDKYFIYYENNTGISTVKGSPFSKLLEKDVNNFYENMAKNNLSHKLLQKRYGYRKFYKIDNIFLRTFLRMFVNPTLVFYILEHFIQVLKKSDMDKNPEPGFLDSSKIL